MANVELSTTIRTVIYRATGTHPDGKFTRQVLRCPETLWKKQGGEAGMAKWHQKRDPRYRVDPDVRFERFEDVDPDNFRRPPAEVKERDADAD